MNRTTGAQRTNKRQDKIWDGYHQQQDKLPPCLLYGRLLELAVSKLRITKDEARNRYGLYTIKQWETLLKLGWNK